jgi:hypothetical protein
MSGPPAPASPSARRPTASPRRWRATSIGWRAGAEALVLAAGPAVTLLGAAGYQVAEVVSPGALAAGAAGPRPLGVVVPGAEVDAYRQAAGDALVVAMDQPRQLDDVLLQLDQRL